MSEPKAPYTPQAAEAPVAWEHTVTNDGGETTDKALSFAPDNFPLMSEKAGDGLFVSLSRRPLIYGDAHPHPQREE